MDEMTFQKFETVLTKDYIKQVQRAWAIVKQDGEEYGDKMFDRFFGDPDIKDYFKAHTVLFNRENKKNHARIIMQTMDNLIVSLEKKESVQWIVMRLVDIHYPIRISKRHFMFIGECLSITMKEMTGANCPKELLNTFHSFCINFVSLVHDVLKSQYDQAEAKRKR